MEVGVVGVEKEGREFEDVAREAVEVEAGRSGLLCEREGRRIPDERAAHRGGNVPSQESIQLLS